MSTDLNSDSEWLRRLIEVMHTIDAPCNGSFASKRVTQALLDRLGLPADIVPDREDTLSAGRRRIRLHYRPLTAMMAATLRCYSKQ